MSGDSSGGHFVSDAADLYRGLRLPEGDERPFVAVNMVASVDGRAVVDGAASALGGPLDRSLMRRIRAAADCVLVGAGTLRAEGYDATVGPEESVARQRDGLPPQPLAAVVTLSGDLPLRRGFFRVAGQRPLVLTSVAAAEAHRERFDALREVAEVSALPGDGARLPASAVLSALRARYGVRRLLVEGGPSLVGDLFAADLVDQLFLTISPRVVGGDEQTIVDTLFRLQPPRQLSLVSAAADRGFLFLRYEVRRQVTAAQ